MLLSLVHNDSPDAPTRNNTRSRLVLAAAQLFQQRGYHGVSTTEILELSRAPRGSLYHYFPEGKAQLAIATVDWMSSEVVKSIQVMRLKGFHCRRIISISVTNIGQWLKQSDYSESPLFAALTIGISQDDDSKLAKSISDAYSKIQSEYSQILIIDGLSKREASSLSMSIVSSIEGSVILSRAMRNISYLEKTKRDLNHLLHQHDVTQ